MRKAGDEPNQSRLNCRRVSHEFTSLQAIGQGGTSTVKKGARRADGRQVALKETRSNETEILSIARKEFELLKSLKHPFIIEAIDFFMASPFQAELVLDYFDGQTLEDALRHAPKGLVAEGVARRPCAAIMQAVAYLHQKGVVHRDIKPQNVMVSADFQDLRLVDFNAACNAADGMLTPTGAKLYAPPEVRRGGSPCEASDIWGVGLCLHLMLSGRLPPRNKTSPIFLMSDRKDSFMAPPYVKSRGSAKHVNLEAPSNEDTDDSSDSDLGASPRGLPDASRVCSRLWNRLTKPCLEVLSLCLIDCECHRPSATCLLSTDWLRDAFGGSKEDVDGSEAETKQGAGAAAEKDKDEQEHKVDCLVPL